MDIPISQSFFRDNIECGSILFFKNPAFPTDHHPHIFLTESDAGILLLSCGTSQKDTIEKYIRTNGLSYQTAVCILPNIGNGLWKETYVNCNDVPFEFDLADLSTWYKNSELRILGKLSDSDIEKLITGYLDSDLVAEWVKELLRPLIP